MIVQFFLKGFDERKVIFCVEAIQMNKKKHKVLAKNQPKPLTQMKSKSDLQSHHSGTEVKVIKHEPSSTLKLSHANLSVMAGVPDLFSQTYQMQENKENQVIASPLQSQNSKSPLSRKSKHRSGEKRHSSKNSTHSRHLSQQPLQQIIQNQT